MTSKPRRRRKAAFLFPLANRTADGAAIIFVTSIEKHVDKKGPPKKKIGTQRARHLLLCQCNAMPLQPMKSHPALQFKVLISPEKKKDPLRLGASLRLFSPWY